METLVLIVFLLAGGLFCYREWQLIKESHRQYPRRPVPPTAPGGGGQTVGFNDRPMIDVTYHHNDAAFTVKPETRMPTWVIILLAAIYVISPIDIIPDFIPIAGQADDLAVIVAAIRSLRKS